MATKSASGAQTRQQQLVLVAERPEAPWRIDEETREIGRQGLARARAVLDATRPSSVDLAA